MTPPFCNQVPILHALIPLRETRQLPVLRIAVETEGTVQLQKL